MQKGHSRGALEAPRAEWETGGRKPSSCPHPQTASARPVISGIAQKMSPSPIEGGYVISGKYQLVRLLGRGSMGEVRLAHHRTLGEDVAIKLLAAAYTASEMESYPTASARFRFEAQVAARLSRKTRHIVRVTDHGEEDGEAPAYLVMELLAGLTLERRLASYGDMPPDEASRLVDQVARALECAHAESVVHRDLKPANIFLARNEDGEGLVKLLDFGIARATRTQRMPSPFSTGEGIVFGTPGYMSPEQACGGEARRARRPMGARDRGVRGVDGNAAAPRGVRARAAPESPPRRARSDSRTQPGASGRPRRVLSVRVRSTDRAPLCERLRARVVVREGHRHARRRTRTDGADARPSRTPRRYAADGGGLPVGSEASFTIAATPVGAARRGFRHRAGHHRRNGGAPDGVERWHDASVVARGRLDPRLTIGPCAGRAVTGRAGPDRVRRCAAAPRVASPSPCKSSNPGGVRSRFDEGTGGARFCADRGAARALLGRTGAHSFGRPLVPCTDRQERNLLKSRLVACATPTGEHGDR